MSKVLIVDPALVERKRVHNILEAAGHSVLEAATPTEAKAILAGLPFGTVQLILTELDFPEPLGLDFIHWLKEHQHLQPVPIQVVTAPPPTEKVVELVSAGADSVISKPFGADMLLRRVTEALAVHGAMPGQGTNLSWAVGDFIHRELKRAERNHLHFSVVYCEDSNWRGRAWAPALLGSLAHGMRESDVLVRAGEHQALILLPDTDALGASVVLARINRTLKRLESDTGEVPAVGMGAATYPEDATDGDSLVSIARERAMQQGRATFAPR